MRLDVHFLFLRISVRRQKKAEKPGKIFDLGQTLRVLATARKTVPTATDIQSGITGLEPVRANSTAETGRHGP
jgi:hypothetical protein